MKTKIYLFLAVCLLLSSCGEEKLNPESIFDSEIPPKTSFDNWLDDNFADPYNIKVDYKLDDMEVPYTHDMVPATIENSKKFAYLIKHIFIDTYAETAKDGSAFLKQYAPRVFTLVGDGDEARGTAEAGLKVVFYWVNTIKFEYDVLATSYFKTIHHEFQHILNQKVTFPSDYAQISDGKYTDQSSESDALKNGFISAYSRRNVGEDIAEIFAWYVVSSPERWNKFLSDAGTDGAAIINQKLSIIKAYMQTNFNVDMDLLREVNFRRMNEMDHLYLDNLPF